MALAFLAQRDLALMLIAVPMVALTVYQLRLLYWVVQEHLEKRHQSREIQRKGGNARAATAGD
jgi:hypothetical protein